MECPHCKRDLHILGRCYTNLDNFGGVINARAECCGKMVTIKAVTQYEIKGYDGDRTEDDWGLAIKQ